MSGFKTWSVGEVLSAASLNTFTMQGNYVIKAADQNVAGTTSMVDDNHLFLSVAANTDYWVEAFIIYGGAAAADMQMTWSFPAGTTFRWTNDALVEPPGVSGDVDRRAYSDTNIVLCSIVGGIDMLALARGVLRVGGTAGTLRFRFTQFVSSGTATTVKAGSLLRITKLT